MMDAFEVAREIFYWPALVCAYLLALDAAAGGIPASACQVRGTGWSQGDFRIQQDSAALAPLSRVEVQKQLHQIERGL